MVDLALCKKLAIKPGCVVAIIGCPPELEAQLPVSDARCSADVVVAFVRNQTILAEYLADAVATYRRGGALWFAYPKKSGTIASDISRDSGWDRLAEHDLLPVSQISVDSDWSALRFRFRDEIGKLTRASDFPGQARRSR